jgi:hypothetical protein
MPADVKRARQEVNLEHDPEKWVPVFRKDHAQIKKIEWDDDSKKSHPALAVRTDPAHVRG